jgi:hypothetical protein
MAASDLLGVGDGCMSTSYISPTSTASRIQLAYCHMLPSYVPYKGTYVPYDGTFGAPDQGQMLDV